ncbi:MAG: DUF1127 domain-containing protein [Rhodobacteraceae bacterium]|nr:DUF1127 domain-containing protein [Paracoccaceae bacterium]
MFNRIKSLIAHWNEVREVNALTDRDLADLGLSRAQVEAFVHMPHDVPDRVMAMSAIFGLGETEVKANHAAWLELLETCGTCHNRGACALVLERGELSRPQDCSFCLNAHQFQDNASLHA